MLKCLLVAAKLRQNVPKVGQRDTDIRLGPKVTSALESSVDRQGLLQYITGVFQATEAMQAVAVVIEALRQPRPVGRFLQDMPGQGPHGCQAFPSNHLRQLQ